MNVDVDIKNLYENFYQKGYSLKKIQSIFHIHIKTLKKLFLKNNLPLKTKEQLKQEKKEHFNETCIKKYGTKHHWANKNIRQKINNTNLEKYNVINVMQNDEIKNKAIQTSLNNWGETNPSKSKLIIEKIANTNFRKTGKNWAMQVLETQEKSERTKLERYGDKYGLTPEIIEKQKKTLKKNHGVDCSLKIAGVREKRNSAFLEKYNVISPMQVSDIKNRVIENIYKNKISTLIPYLEANNYEWVTENLYKGVYNKEAGYSYNRYKIKHLICGNIFEDDVYLLPRCPFCFSDPQSSVGEAELKSYIEKITYQNFDKIRNIINPETESKLEIDIYNDNLKIGFEYNSEFHTAKYKKYNYHKMKSELCLQKDIKLYHIWYFQDKDIIKSKLDLLFKSNIVKIGGRKLQVKKISSKDAKIFADRTHLHGGIFGSLNFGLYKDDKLLSVLILKRKGNIFEIARFCSELNTTIIGGFSKMFKQALKTIKHEYKEITKIFSYVDRDWSPDWKATVYYKSGFTFLGATEPSLFYVKGKKVYNRQVFQKYKLKALFPDVYDKNLTEQQILSLKHIYPIYNSGNWKLELNL